MFESDGYLKNTGDCVRKGFLFMDKKGIIIYYSWIGNTQVVAEEIKRITSFNLLRIEEKKERKFKNIMVPAMSAFFGLKSNIKPLDYSLGMVDNVFLGAQVWAGKTTPAINKFLSKANFKGKNVWVFITKADENIPQKVIDSITKRIEKRGGIVMDSLSLTTKWDPKTNIPVTAEEIRTPLQNWIKDIDFK
jgi:flavodoxin